MSEAKFTRGQWVVYIGACDTQEIHVDDYTVVGWQGFDGVAICEDEKTANAHLIAAAPDMYNELQNLLDIFNHESKSVTILDVIRIEKLLAKARGES